MKKILDYKYIGIVAAILGVVMFSAKAVMVKLAYQYDVDKVDLLLFRMLFAVPFYIVIALVNKPKHPDQIVKKDYWWILFLGFVGYYLASYFDFWGLQYIKAALERIILFVYPTLVLIISWIFLKKKITKPQTLAIIITYLGVLVTFWGEIDTSGNVPLGSFLIFMSALTYASYLVGSGWLIPKFGPVVFTAYAMIVSTLCVIGHYLLNGAGDLFKYDIEVYQLSLMMAIFSTLIPSFMVSFAIKKLGASHFAIIGSLGPISTILLANVFLGERMTVMQILGAAIVIGGILMISRQKK